MHYSYGWHNDNNCNIQIAKKNYLQGILQNSTKVIKKITQKPATTSISLFDLSELIEKKLMKLMTITVMLYM